MVIEHDNIIYMSDIPDVRRNIYIRFTTCEKVQGQGHRHCIQDLPIWNDKQAKEILQSIPITPRGQDQVQSNGNKF